MGLKRRPSQARQNQRQKESQSGVPTHLRPPAQCQYLMPIQEAGFTSIGTQGALHPHTREQGAVQ